MWVKFKAWVIKRLTTEELRKELYTRDYISVHRDTAEELYNAGLL